jgi:prepilin-type N-terminal cleavage/methylation domain-containing protein
VDGFLLKFFMTQKGIIMNIKKHKKSGFSLIEVVLAIGVFSLAILALVGLMGPMMSNADEVTDISEATGLTDKIEGYLEERKEEIGFDELYTSWISPTNPSSDIWKSIYEVSTANGRFIGELDEASGEDGKPIKSTIQTLAEGTVFKIHLGKNESVQEVTDIGEEAHMVIQVQILSGPARQDPTDTNIVWNEVFSYTMALLR